MRLLPRPATLAVPRANVGSSLQVIFVLPTAYPVTKENLNYSGVAVGVVLIFSLG